MNSQWRDTLQDDERALVDLALKLHERIDWRGACHHLSFFISVYLFDLGIRVDPVVGYVNDGTDEIYMSHTWLELNGQITDITLCKPLQPDIQIPGSAIIHGKEIKKGCKYLYVHKRPENAQAQVDDWIRNGQLPMNVINEEEETYLRKAEVGNAQAMRSYLDNAPIGKRYCDIKGIIEKP